MDLTASIAPKSDQINFEDLAINGPQTFTVKEVTKGSAEQPFDFQLVEIPGRAYRPSKTMRRVIVAAWGPDTTNYAGRRFTLYGDPEVKFGGQKVGGIKISALSHIDKPLSLNLTVTRSKRAPHTVQPLPDAPTQQPTPSEPSADEVAASTDVAWLRGQWKASSPDRRAQIEARVTELGDAS